MTSTARRLLSVAFLALAAVAFASPAAYAQGGVTSTLNGTVADASGAVIPGANVTVKRADTGVNTEAVTNTEGQFTIPALNAGTYTVTVSLSGFKTVTLNNVVLNAGVPAGVKVTMEVAASRSRSSSRPAPK